MERLNRIERLKKNLKAYDFMQRLHGMRWENLDDTDRFYLKNYGIYQIGLRSDRFMLRLRLDGGRLEAEKAKTIAETALSEKLKILLTARAQIELHNIPPKRIFPLWKKLNGEGIETFQTLTDNFRALTTDPLDGISPDSRIECFPILQEIRKTFIGMSEWMGTIPRKFNTAVIGTQVPSFNPWGNDLLFALADKNGRWGFNIYLGGKNSETAGNADIFCFPEDVCGLFGAIASVYGKYGPRGSRSKTRLFHMIEKTGMENIRIMIENEYGSGLATAGRLRMGSSAEYRDPFHIDRYGNRGEIHPEIMLRISRRAGKENVPLRLSPNQEILFIRSGKEDIVHTAKRHTPVTACAGSRYCPLSLWDVKKDLELLPIKKLEHLGISLGFSGCLKGCGRHYHNDLGFIGLRTNLFGPTERAVRVFLGALQSPHPSPGRMLYYSVPLRRLNDLVEAIMEDFEHSKTDNFETFNRKTLRLYGVGTLQLWYLARQLWKLDGAIMEDFFRGDEKACLSTLRSLPGFPAHPDLYETVRELSHRLWDMKVSPAISPPRT